MRWKERDEIKVKSTIDYQEMKEFFLDDTITRVGHNITLYDERMAAKLLGVSPRGKIIDTLALSWYLYPERTKHGLEEWGKEFGIHKVQIDDWNNLSNAQYIERCEQDTKINFTLYEQCIEDLKKIYDENSNNNWDNLIDYLGFKLDCIKEQEEVKIRLDIGHIERVLAMLKQEKTLKEHTLKQAMPQIPIKGSKTYRNVILMDGGEFYEKTDPMYNNYVENGHTPVKSHKIEIIKGYKEGNPNSVQQKKAWLDSLGWRPENFKYVREQDNKLRKIPQIASKENDGTVCPSIQKLFQKEPRLELLEGLTILTHRIGLLEGFLKNQRNGYLEASMAGFTNTLRFKHVNIVNLPGVSKKFGEEIRGSLIAEEGGLLCGSDMSSLEDSTKQHYMYPYDPDYVAEMRTPGFDPHLDIGVRSGILSKDDADFYKYYEKRKKEEETWIPTPGEKARFNDIKAKRHKAKTTNFSSIYGVGAEKLGRELNIPVKQSRRLLDGYWVRNEAIKKVAAACLVKEVDGRKWLYNPVSKLWYSLRAEKDRFSTLNQGTGVWCFDMYVRHVRQQGIKISVQMHDEILFKIERNEIESIKRKLDSAIQRVNEIVQLNVPLGISMDTGNSYADCH